MFERFFRTKGKNSSAVQIPADESNSETVINQRLCFTIPASPSDSFFSQIAMFRLSLDYLGGSYSNAIIQVVLGDNKISQIDPKWLNLFGDKVQIRWADISLFNQYGHDAQSDTQLMSNYDEFDLVCIVDADTLLINPIDDLIVNIMHNPALGGVIAHYPFPIESNEAPMHLWNGLFKEFVGRSIDYKYKYTLVEINQTPEEHLLCPFYVNFGFLIMPPKLLYSIRDTFLEIRHQVAKKLYNPYFSAQVTLALSTEKNNIPVRALDMKYNFPNDPLADLRYINELNDVRLIHYLRRNIFDRHQIFTSKKMFDNFLNLQLTGSNKKFQDRILQITDGIYPFH